MGINIFKNYDCSLIKKVVSAPEIKSAHENKLEERLAERLAFKVERSLEEIAILDQYFNQFKVGLADEPAVQENCKVEVIANPKCDGHPATKVSERKLKKLISKFSSQGNNLSAKMQDIFRRSVGVVETTKNTCPLNPPSGYYTIGAQFNEHVSNNLYKFLSRKSEQGTKKWLEDAYTTFPQLKLIRRAAKAGEAKFEEEFESYIRAYQPEKMPIKAYVLGFFTDKKNSASLSSGLASTCNEIKQNVKNFLCGESMPTLVLSDESAEYLFADDEDVEESLDISKAFSCDYTNEKDKIKKENGPEDLFSKFTANVEAQLPKKSSKGIKAVDSFCENFLCKSDKVKNTASCNSGGPVSADDLKMAYSCGNEVTGKSDIDCTTQVRQWISYLDSLDLDKKKAENIELAKILGLELNVHSDVKEKKREFSRFTQNFLGVEGTLLAEGKKITPRTVAEKVREFEDRKIEVIPSQNKDIILANNDNNKVYNLIRQQKENEALESQVQNNQQVVQNFPAYEKDADQKQEIISNSISKFARTNSATAKKDGFEEIRDNGRREEISKMRSELESVIRGMKGSDEEKLATVADSNAAFGKPGIIPVQADTYRGMSREERERLEQYRQNLQNWESRLRSREFDLDTRDTRSSSRSVAADKSENERRYDSSASGNPGDTASGQPGNPAQSAGLGGVKLSKGQSAVQPVTGNEQAAGETQKNGTVQEGEALVMAESLATLEKSSLIKLGIGQRDSFIIKVKLQERIYDVPVKSFTYNGKSMFVPLLTKENRELAKLLLESPLFAEYRRYQTERERTVARH